MATFRKTITCENSTTAGNLHYGIKIQKDRKIPVVNSGFD